MKAPLKLLAWIKARLARGARGVKAFLGSTQTVRLVEHLAVVFAGAFALTAISTLESKQGLQLSWSLVGAAALAGATAGYHAVRPALVRLAAGLIKQGARRA